MLIFFSFIFFTKCFHRCHNDSHTEGKINNSRGIYLLQSLNRPGVYLGPGGNLGQTFNSFISKIRDENHKLLQLLCEFSGILLGNSCLLQVKLLRWRKRFSQPALTANSSSLLSLTVVYICFSITLIILWDTLSWRARLLITYCNACLSQAPR